MAVPFLSGINLNQTELLNARIQNLASAPGSPVTGQVWYDTTTGKLVVREAGANVSYSVTTHNHDGTYYTQAAVDALLANKSDTAHSHTPDYGLTADIATLDFATSKAQGVNAKLARADHAHNLTGVASSTHNHDATYYTQAAVDALLAGKSSTSHNHDATYISIANHTKALHDGLGIDAATVGSASAANLRDRSTHTGTQLATTISNFDTAVRTSRLDQMAVPTTNVSMNSQRIINVADPTGPTDAANKQYVDAARSGLDVKDSVRVASTANLNLSSPGATIDGISMVSGDRVLVKNQSTASANGIYVWNGAASAMTRALDADVSAEVTAGMFTFVAQGTVHADQGWVLTTDDPIVLGTTALAFAQFSGTGTLLAGAGLIQSGQSFDIGSGNGITVAADHIELNYGAVGGALTVGVAAANGVATTPSRSDHTHGMAAGSAPPAIANAASAGAAGSPARSDHTHAGLTRFAANVGDNSSTAIVLTHSLGTRDVSVNVFRATTPWEAVYCDVEATSTTQVTLRFAVAPTTAQYRAVVIG